MTENAAISDGWRREERVQVGTECGDWGGRMMLGLSFSGVQTWISSTSKVTVMVGQCVEPGQMQNVLRVEGDSDIGRKDGLENFGGI